MHNLITATKDEQDEKSKKIKRRKVKRVSAERLKRLVSKYGRDKIAEAFDFDESSIRNWLRSEQMPANVSLMCEAIERRNGLHDPDETTLLIVKVRKLEAEYVMETLSRLDIDDVKEV